MSKRLIFVVEDDEIIRDSFKEMFEDSGYQLETFASGIDCLQKIEAGTRPGIILLDHHMPLMDGPEFMHALTALGITKAEVPVYLCSGVDGSLLQEKLGCAGTLRKPFNLKTIFDVVDRHCG